MSQGPTTAEVYQVAKLAVSAFKSRGLSTYLFGGAACCLYGNSRTPGDVDIVILTSSHTTEELKLLLTQLNSKFYLRNPRALGATYKVLYARLRGNLAYPRRSCKVDILIPGILNLPSVPTQYIGTINGLPVMPLIPLILMKLQGWSDHRASSRSDMVSKQYLDIRDISQLLQIAIQRNVKLNDVVGWLPDEFVDAGRERLASYLQIVRPAQPHLWQEIGFDAKQ